MEQIISRLCVHGDQSPLVISDRVLNCLMRPIGGQCAPAQSLLTAGTAYGRRKQRGKSFLPETHGRLRHVTLFTDLLDGKKLAGKFHAYFRYVPMSLCADVSAAHEKNNLSAPSASLRWKLSMTCLTARCARDPENAENIDWVLTWLHPLDYILRIMLYHLNSCFCLT
jgi:hypothetical protein